MTTTATSGMATPDEPTGPGNTSRTYLEIDGFKAFWQASQPDRIHLAVGDSRFSDENGAKPGIRIVFSSNPDSADYNPANFNRVARALRAVGAPAPADEVPLASRKLKDRSAARSAAAAAAGPAPTGGPQNPADYGWAACPTCHSVVVDLEAHAAEAH